MLKFHDVVMGVAKASLKFEVVSRPHPYLTLYSSWLTNILFESFIQRKWSQKEWAIR